MHLLMNLLIINDGLSNRALIAADADDYADKTQHFTSVEYNTHNRIHIKPNDYYGRI